MSSSTIEQRLDVRATAVKVTEDVISVDLEDGRTVVAPIVWYPRLRHGTPTERANLEIGPYGIHWPDLDEDISIRGLLLGNKSGESQGSLKRWLEHRARGEKVPVQTIPPPDWMREPDVNA